MSKIYLIGSLRNARLVALANVIEARGHTVFADWHAPGPETDQFWQRYEVARGRTYLQALDGPHAWHVFEYDKHWLDWCEKAVMVQPCGRSAHLELGYVIGQGKPGYILLYGQPERWDVMYRFAAGVYNQTADLLKALSAAD